MPGRKTIHTKKWDRCVRSVRTKIRRKGAAEAICTRAIGYKGSVLKGHRRR